MSGGVQWLTLPAGYLGSSFIGASLMACGFDTNASKIASIVMAVFFLFTLWWAKRNWLCVLSVYNVFWIFVTLSGMVLFISQIMGFDPGHVGPDRLILVRRRRSRSSIFCEFLVGAPITPRYIRYSFKVLFIGVMSCMYALWDVIGMPT